LNPISAAEQHSEFSCPFLFKIVKNDNFFYKKFQIGMKRLMREIFLEKISYSYQFEKLTLKKEKFSLQNC
jgi:hypothetical protein